jgi:hypothetical protein
VRANAPPDGRRRSAAGRRAAFIEFHDSCGDATLLVPLQRFAICGPVRARLGVDRLGVGLWIARAAASELVADAGARTELRRALAEQGRYVYTLNGFPYGGFDAPRPGRTRRPGVEAARAPVGARPASGQFWSAGRGPPPT